MSTYAPRNGWGMKLQIRAWFGLDRASSNEMKTLLLKPFMSGSHPFQLCPKWRRVGLNVLASMKLNDQNSPTPLHQTARRDWEMQPGSSVWPKKRNSLEHNQPVPAAVSSASSQQVKLTHVERVFIPGPLSQPMISFFGVTRNLTSKLILP